MNYYTEEEAQERWCPFAGVVNFEGGSANRGPNGKGLGGSHCLASKCMAWRNGVYRDPKGSIATVPDGVMFPNLVEVGYCGLAGKN